jgi:16S rRNA (guanine966-N2)-methyltransferase
VQKENNRVFPERCQKGEVPIIRVIAGEAGGIRLKTPKGLNTRPTVDRVKESMFNILAPYIKGRILDLFSGTGALGIEALSRGADYAVFVDSNRNCCRIISENLERTGFLDKAEVYCCKAASVIKELGKKKSSFDIVFIDPPYLRNFIQETLQLLIENDIIKRKGILIVEHHRDEPVQTVGSGLELYRSADYGETIVSFLVFNG